MLVRSSKLLTPTGALRASWAVFIVLLASVGCAALCVAYTAREQARSDRQWCDLLRSLDAPLQKSPVPTARQVAIAQEIHALRQGKGC